MFTILLQNKNFRYLWLSQLISALGDRLAQMGILTFVMVIAADKGDKMALITFFNLLPFSLLGPFCGALTDRYSHKNLMVLTDSLRAVLIALIPIVWINTHSVTLMIAWFFLLGSLLSLFIPTKMGMLTKITDKDTLLRANSLLSATGMIALLVGTFIAGIAIKLTGIRVAFYINALTYVFSAILLSRIIYTYSPKQLKIPKDTYRTLLKDIKSGVRYINSHTLIKRIIILSSVASFISGFAYILLLNYGTTILKQQSLGMGILLSSAGLGMLVGAFILSQRKGKIKYSPALYLSCAIIGVSTFTFIFRPSFYFTLILLFFAGSGVSILMITIETIFQRITTDEFRGKVFAARGAITNAVFLISLLLVGVVIRFIAVEKLFCIIGLISLALSLRIFLFERRWGYQLFRWFIRLLLKWLFFFKVSGLKNLPRNKSLIFAGNHTSLIDGVALAAAYPNRVYFLVADTIFQHAFWGWTARRLKYIPIKRGGFNKESIKKAVDILQSGNSIGVFPEGKISRDGQLDEGKEGIAVIARLANADIVPFAIEGAYEAWPLPKKFPKRFPVEVRFGKPIDVNTYAAPQDLLKEVMQDIAGLKREMEREGYLQVEPGEIVRHLIKIG